MKKRKVMSFDNPTAVYMDYHRRYLWNFLMNLFKWNGMPETVDLRFFNDKLLSEGWSPVFDYRDIGYISTDGAYSGLDHYYRPVKFESANPVLKTVKRQVSHLDNIKEGGVCICYNTNNYRAPESMNEITEIYAYKLAQLDVSTDTSIVNSRVCMIPVVGDEKEAQRVINNLKDIYAGKPATLSYKNSFGGGEINIFPIKARDNIVTSELADSKNNIFREFLERLGIDCVKIEKKERVLESEAESNQQELEINKCIYLEPRERFCEELNRTFGLNVSVELNAEAVKELLREEGESDEGKEGHDTDK